MHSSQLWDRWDGSCDIVTSLNRFLSEVYGSSDKKMLLLLNLVLKAALRSTPLSERERERAAPHSSLPLWQSLAMPLLSSSDTSHLAAFSVSGVKEWWEAFPLHRVWLYFSQEPPLPGNLSLALSLQTELTLGPVCCRGYCRGNIAARSLTVAITTQVQDADW